MPSSKKWLRWSGLSLVLALSLACDLGSLLVNSQQATAEAFGTAIEGTRLADALTSTADVNATSTVRALPTTPAPTSTPFPSRTPDLAATAAFEATRAPIREVLPAYGIDPNVGFLGWTAEPKTIELQTYLDTAYVTDYINVPTRNFVVQADVTWTTKTGLAGCGFIFRADQEQNAYAMGIARGATGVALFNIVRGGRVAGKWQTKFAPATNDGNGETNRLAIVASENTFNLYVNGQFSYQAVHDEFQVGGVAFAALSESGTSVCTYNNGWLWILDT